MIEAKACGSEKRHLREVLFCSSPDGTAGPAVDKQAQAAAHRLKQDLAELRSRHWATCDDLESEFEVHFQELGTVPNWGETQPSYFAMSSWGNSNVFTLPHMWLVSPGMCFVFLMGVYIYIYICFFLGGVPFFKSILLTAGSYQIQYLGLFPFNLGTTWWLTLMWQINEASTLRDYFSFGSCPFSCGMKWRAKGKPPVLWVRYSEIDLDPRVCGDALFLQVCFLFLCFCCLESDAFCVLVSWYGRKVFAFFVQTAKGVELPFPKRE